jgi:hypothetical protein
MMHAILDRIGEADSPRTAVRVIWDILQTCPAVRPRAISVARQLIVRSATQERPWDFLCLIGILELVTATPSVLIRPKINSRTLATLEEWLSQTNAFEAALCFVGWRHTLATEWPIPLQEKAFASLALTPATDDSQRLLAKIRAFAV